MTFTKVQHGIIVPQRQEIRR